MSFPSDFITLTIPITMAITKMCSIRETVRKGALLDPPTQAHFCSFLLDFVQTARQHCAKGRDDSESQQHRARAEAVRRKPEQPARQ